METCTDYRQRDSHQKKSSSALQQIYVGDSTFPDTKIYPVTKQSQSNRIALLINNLKFNASSYTRGAERDEWVMDSLLQTMRYEVVTYRNLTAQMINLALKEFSEHPKLALTDSVFVIILSYGGMGTKCGTDDEQFEIDTIFQNLNTTNCPRLKDKPKIIIIQDCRGVEEGSVELTDGRPFVATDSIRSPSVNFAKHAQLQTEKDFIVFHSSAPYTVSQKHATYGSVFIQHIAEVFREYHRKVYIQHMFTMVMQRFEESPFNHIQMPTKERDTLTKCFYLFPDTPEEVKQRSAGEEDLCGRLNIPWVESDGVQWVRSDLRKYSCKLRINTNTVYKWFKLSDGNRKVTRVDAKQPYPDHADTFDRPQLLCTDGLTGRCYWEVQWSGDVSIAVSYRGIKRRADSQDCLFGFNNQSWTLDCSYCYSVLHNNKETFVFSFRNFKDFNPVSNRVAVYVDVPAGTLSFFTISSDTLIHLYTFSTTFTEPLYPGFGLWSHHSSVSLC